MAITSEEKIAGLQAEVAALLARVDVLEDATIKTAIALIAGQLLGISLCSGELIEPFAKMIETKSHREMDRVKAALAQDANFRES